MWKEYLSTGGVYMIAGISSSFFMGLLRSNKKRFLSKIGEGFTCSLLSTGLITISNYFLPDYPQVAIFVGVFVGFLGSEYLTELIKNLINIALDRLEIKK
jgi:hypothetical protein